MSQVSGYKGGGGKQHTPTEAPDSIHSLAKIRMLLALGEGEFESLSDDQLRKRTYLNGTPVRNSDGSENFPSVRLEYRPGTQGQEPISGFSAVESETGVGVEVLQTRAWSALISDTSLNAVRIRVGFPALQKQTDKGDLVGAQVDYQIFLQTDNGAEVVFDYRINDKTTTLYERDHRIDLPQANSNWRIGVRRITADSSSAKIQDKLQVQSWTGIINANLRYPHTALLFIELDAKSFQNTPAVSLRALGRKVNVPSNYDPATRAYIGDWDGTFKMAWTDNPAWHWYDICVMDRFGLGRRIRPEMLNRYALYQIAQRCDQLVPDGKGGQEPRFIMNIYIQSKQEAWTILKDMAACFAGMSWWGGQMLNIVSDTPVAAMAHVITNASVVDGQFSYASGSAQTRNSTFIVNYSDPDNHYKDTPAAGQRIDLVRRYKINPIEITAIGCTRESEAQRRGHWALISNMLDKQVSFKVGLEGLFFMPGTVVAIADADISGGLEVRGGRVVSATGRTVITDQPITFQSGDALQVRNAAGVMQSVTIASATTVVIDGVERGNLTLATSPGEIPEARPFVIDGGNLQTQLFRITKVKGSEDGVSFDVTGVEYNESKYDAVDKGSRLDTRILTNIPDGTITAPASVTISGNEVMVQSKRVTNLRISWEKVEKAVAYEVQFRRMNLSNTTIGEWANDWINVPRTAGLGVEVPDVFAGNYVARVRAIGPGEISSPWVSSDTVAITGRQGDVPKPVNFTATDNVVFGINLSWGFAGDAEDTLNTEIQYSETATGDSPALLADVPYPQATYSQMGLKAGKEFWYRARLVDRIGNMSDWTDWTRGQASIDVSDVTDAILEQIKDTDLFKEMIEDAVTNSAKIAELANAVVDNADQLAAAVGSNKQTAEALIHNSLAIADVVVRQSAQNAANSASYQNLREVIATETEARVTDVTRLEAATKDNAAALTEVRQTIADETEARTTAVDELKASTNAAGIAAGQAGAAAAKNTADLTTLRQTVTDQNSAMASRLDELGASMGDSAARAQNNAIASLTNSVAQVTQSVKLSAQYATQQASISRVDRVVADASNALAESVKRMDVAAGNSIANSTDFTQVAAAFGNASATKINSLTATVNGNTALISQTAQITTDLSGQLSAMYNVKVALDSNGRQYVAGLGLGIQNTPAGMQSQVLFIADRFAVMASAGATVQLPFVIENGQTFINDVFIKDGTITNAKIGAFIQSNGFTANVTGWRLSKSGIFENYASDGSGAMKQTGSTISIRDGNGRLRVQIGQITGAF